MEEAFLGLLVALIISLCWIVLNWIWLEPKRMENYLREQGIRGPPYILFYGNMKDKISLMKKERSKPMDFSHRIVPRLLPFVHQSVQTYGKIFVSWNGPTPRLCITDPEMIRDILSNKFGHFTKTKPSPLIKLLAEGVINYNGEKWVKHRRIINPAFHLEKLKMMMPAFYTCCSELVGKWQMLVSEGSSELDVWPYLQSLTADVISRTAFGSSYQEGRQIFQLQTEQAQLLMKASSSIYIPGVRYLPTKRNNRMKKIHNEVENLLRDLIKRSEQAMKRGDMDSENLLGILMESNQKDLRSGANPKNYGLSISEVIEECKLFYFAGQETTSTLLLWTMILLSMHPEWQQKARNEVLQVFGRKKPDYERLNQLKTVTMILYEVLRLYPPIVMLTRATYEKTKVGQFHLPAGMHIQMPVLLIHHDSELWDDDVEEFNPKRFSGGISKAAKHPLSFCPFGWGPRICIGQTFAIIESKMALAMILQNFSFKLSATYLHAPTIVVTVQPQHGAQLILHKL